VVRVAGADGWLPPATVSGTEGRPPARLERLPDGCGGGRGSAKEKLASKCFESTAAS